MTEIELTLAERAAIVNAMARVEGKNQNTISHEKAKMRRKIRKAIHATDFDEVALQALFIEEGKIKLEMSNEDVFVRRAEAEKLTDAEIRKRRENLKRCIRAGEESKSTHTLDLEQARWLRDELADLEPLNSLAEAHLDAYDKIRDLVDSMRDAPENEKDETDQAAVA